MGWSSGTSIMEAIISTIEDNVDDLAIKRSLYCDIILAFEEADWDNIDEVIGISEVFDEVAADVQQPCCVLHTEDE
jgi:hypothetical protein